MKTYNQVVCKALLVGVCSYFGGGSIYDGAYAYVDAVQFIYGVDRDIFINDIESDWKKLEIKMVVEDMSSDEVIEYLQNKIFNEDAGDA